MNPCKGVDYKTIDEIGDYPFITIKHCPYLPDTGKELCPRHELMKATGVNVELPPAYYVEVE